MYHILKRWGIPALILLMLALAACSTSTRTRRTIKKKCDCRKWSTVTTPNHMMVADGFVLIDVSSEPPTAHD